MALYKKLGAAFLALSISVLSLTGCTSADRTAIEETANSFLSIVTSGTTENIEKYASDEVTNSPLVKVYDTEYLVDSFKEGFITDEIDEETAAKVDEVCSLISNMVTDYEITDVSVNKDGKGVIVAIINTAFPVNIIESDEAVERRNAVAEEYYTENQETIEALYAEHTEEEVEAIVYNDMIYKIFEVYEDMINNASPESYAIVLTAEKNAETDSWYITDVSSYDSAANGATAPATDTATTADSISADTASSETSAE